MERSCLKFMSFWKAGAKIQVLSCKRQKREVAEEAAQDIYWRAGHWVLTELGREHWAD